jgi:probable addiction module antidote protein
MTKIMLEDSEKRIIEELKDPKEAALFLNELLSVSDANPEIRYKAFLKGLSLVMKAYGISKLAKSTGLNRTNLYQSIVSEKNTKLDKVFKILDELDLNIEITSKPRKQAESIYPIHTLPIPVHKNHGLFHLSPASTRDNATTKAEGKRRIGLC